MALIRKRKCPECGGEMEAKLINLHYKRQNVEMEVEVIGIPANVCTRCFYRIIPGKVAKYIDALVDPIFESESRIIEKILPSPSIDIQFPFISRDVYADQ
ncbi:MAG: YgiT-type zinc finger protein [Pseudomonadota bacterium]|nr:YgiT-type zinc finger protein [Pseudomonadota bacterium]